MNPASPPAEPKPLRRSLARRAAVLLSVLAPLAFMPARAAQEETRTGWLHVVWRDEGPQARPAGVSYHLVDERGRGTELLLDGAEVPGGVLSLDRRRVAVSGARRAGAGGPALRVSAIRVVGAAPPPTGFRRAVAPGADPVGVRPFAIILCRFSDRPTYEPRTEATYRRWLGNAYPGLDHYWTQMSQGRLSIAGSVLAGPYVLPQPLSGYMNGSTPDFGALVRDCAGAADADLDFTGFAGVNMQFNGNFNNFSYGGGWALTADGQTRQVGMTWMSDWAAQTTYAHEFGHAFGLPHSSGPYTGTYDSKWDVMSGGGSFDAAEGTHVGNYTISYHRDFLGWVPANRKHVARPGATEVVVLERAALPGPDGALMLQVPIPGTQSFYTAEARRWVAPYDVASRLPAEGVVLHRVTPSDNRPARVVDGDGNGNTNDAGAVWTPGETFTDAEVGLELRVLDATPTGFRVEVSLPAALSVEGDASRPPAVMGAPYTDRLIAAGAQGDVVWTLAAGTLPPGLALTSAGSIIGIPTQAGTFRFTVDAHAGRSRGARELVLVVGKPPLQGAAVFDQLLGGAAGRLTEDEARYLDLLGNRNGRVDVGDVRAWLADTGGIPAPADEGTAAGGAQ